MSRSTVLRRKYRHSHTAFVESFNMALAEKLLVVIDMKELQTQEDNKKQVKHLLSGVVDELNKRKIR